MEFEFDLSSFLIGCLVGIVTLSILRLKALKELRLKLEAIGVDLGIEGFGETPSNPSAQSIGPVSGNSNEINQAGRDINKTSNLYKTMKAAAAAAAAAEDNKHPSSRIFQLVTRFHHHTQNSSLKHSLSQIKGSGDNWPERYYAAYIADNQFKSDLSAELDRLAAYGWRFTTVRPIDNLDMGVLFEITSVKPIGLQG
ncbi:hypothetical protein [Lysobacter sp. Root690]|uniref:hypothetical protein n=1 Tax=Lysobacter sp. Root690 TaxID=1736588 RepID=UPI0012F8FDBB|nr:hypothetical protein [Lysobacter sp. Root690]